MASSDLLQGTLDMLVLKTLVLGPLHGYTIARRIQQLSGEVLRGARCLPDAGPDVSPRR
jgi:DNA-binding PadR family transcriptional regulator